MPVFKVSNSFYFIYIYICIYIYSLSIWKIFCLLFCCRWRTRFLRNWKFVQNWLSVLLLLLLAKSAGRGVGDRTGHSAFCLLECPASSNCTENNKQNRVTKRQPIEGSKKKQKKPNEREMLLSNAESSIGRYGRQIELINRFNGPRTWCSLFIELQQHAKKQRTNSFQLLSYV